MHLSSRRLRFVRMGLDLSVLLVSFWLAASVSAHRSGAPVKAIDVLIAFILLLVWAISSMASGLYQEYRSRDFSYEFVGILKNVILQGATVIVILFWVKEAALSRTFVSAYVILSLLLLMAEKLSVDKVFMFMRLRKNNWRRVLIIGAGRMGREVADNIKSHPEYGYNVVGFLDDRARMNGQHLGPVDDLERVLAARKVDDIIIALPSYAHKKIDRCIRTSLSHNARPRLVPDYFRGFPFHYQEMSTFGNVPMITAGRIPLEELQFKFVKRVADIIISALVILFVLSWLIPLLYVIQKAMSPGPLFFVQDRIGKRNRPFGCIKFRTMTVEASSCNGFTPTTQNDHRVTKLGIFLRKSNIDELPQFINVFLGHMSVVGPRAHAVAFHENYKSLLGHIDLRHFVKPGITGWAQVHGSRGDSPDPEENKKRIAKRIEYDLWYIENWSMWLDAQIIFRTIVHMLKGDPHAY